ncbi:hypothetical protein RFI_27861 [Reticulomyxa filosa]|uniref:Mitochondrial carrier protein n=1 Tax=Reticulomyxa filosa TaxID=46433 RepID=X6M799_RETFI|nr:hypothetical protein RFI_27861 [Reticulomyxa filosa]|eukprot:ETO09516.1 hypothetical protein RFI_27861 [Reticulomyxa filosa]
MYDPLTGGRKYFEQFRPTEKGSLDMLQNTPESATIRGEIQVARQYGFFGLLRGFHITVLRDAPAFAVYFPLYAYVVHHYDPNHKTTLIPFMAGGLAGLMSWYVVYPIDVMKTQYQARENHYRSGFFHGVRLQFHERGFASFYQGVGATMLVCFVSLSTLKGKLQLKKQKLTESFSTTCITRLIAMDQKEQKEEVVSDISSMLET